LAGKIFAIVQARMGASRLPNKMMLHLHGYPVIEWIYRRLLSSRTIEGILFALPEGENDDALAHYLRFIGADCFRGSKLDLVNRFYTAARSYQLSTIIRICADNPLICPGEIDRLVNFYLSNSCDYAYNHIPKNNNYPDGLGAEVCGIDLLSEIHRKATEHEHREHLFNYVWANKDNYQILTLDAPTQIAFPKLKFDLDTMDDYKRLIEKPYRIEMSACQIVQIALSK